MLKSESFKFISMIVERIWTQKKNTIVSSLYLDVWDTGRCRYERGPDGIDKYWEVLERRPTETGFIERLRLQQAWDSPGQVLHQERLPLRVQKDSFEIPGWWVQVQTQTNTPS